MTAPVAVQDTELAVRPHPFGLMSVVADTIDAPRWSFGTTDYLLTPRPSGVVRNTDCAIGPTAALDLPEGRPFGEAVPFEVDAGFTCKSVGITRDEVQAHARRTLEVSRGPLIEAHMWPLFTADAVTPFGTTAVSLVAGIGLLEDWLTTNYGAAGAMHINRRAASSFAERHQLTRVGEQLRTVLDTPVAFGNYPLTGPLDGDDDPLPAAAGTAWLVATGQVITAEGEIKLRSAEGSAYIDTTTNVVTGIASQQFIVGFDDVSAAVLVTL